LTNNFKCPRCDGNVFTHGKAGSGKVRYECKDCGFKTTTPLDKEAESVMVQKYLIIPDTHAPYENKRAVASACEYSAFYKPHHLIHIGDVGDYKSVSHWMKNKKLESEKLRIVDELTAACDLLKLFASTAPEASKMVLLGNHDRWVYDYVNEHPALEGTISVDRSYRQAGWQTTPFNQLYRIGKLYLTHGLFTNMYHAAKTVHSLSVSCMYGHTHDDQKHTESFVDGQKTAQAIGCLCDMNPEYLQNRPNKWVSGFATVDVLPNGQFFPDFIKIIDGRFSKMGKIYGG
jgi:predicted phosphodiesterase